MPVHAIYIQKEVEFQGDIRPFGNTYHYQSEEAPTPESLSNLADFVLDAERTLTPDQVQFIGIKAWGPTDGTEFDNVMKVNEERDLAGSVVAPFESYREACLHVRWGLPRSEATNSQRWLRKYLRMCQTGATDPAVQQGFQRVAQGDKDAIRASYLDPVTGPVTNNGVTSLLCTADGVLANNAGTVRDFYITRQIGS